MNEWQQWQQEDQQRVSKKQRRGDAHSLAPSKTSLASPVSQPTAQGVKKQQSLLIGSSSSFGASSSSKALLPPNINHQHKKPTPSSSSADSPITVTASHAAAPQPRPIKLARTTSKVPTEVAAPFLRSQETAEVDKEKEEKDENPVEGLDLRQEAEEEEEMSFHRAEAGRSLGEDEEVLFEGGCTQMLLPPPTLPSAPSPSPSPSAKEQPPSFPTGLPTSTPHHKRHPAPASISAPAGAEQPEPSAAATLPSPDSSPAKPSTTTINIPLLPRPGEGERLLDGLHSPFLSHANSHAPPTTTVAFSKVAGEGEASSFFPFSQALSSSASPVRGKLSALEGEGDSQRTGGSSSQRLLNDETMGDITSFLEEETTS